MTEPKLTEQEYMKLMLEVHSNLINIQSIADRIRSSGGWAFPKVIRLGMPEVYLISSDDTIKWKMPTAAKPYETENSTGLEFFIGSVRFHDQHTLKEA